MAQLFRLLVSCIALALATAAMATPAIFGNTFERYVVDFMQESDHAESCVSQLVIGVEPSVDCTKEIEHVRYLAEVKSVQLRTEEDRVAVAKEILRILVSDAKRRRR